MLVAYCRSDTFRSFELGGLLADGFGGGSGQRPCSGLRRGRPWLPASAERNLRLRGCRRSGLLSFCRLAASAPGAAAPWPQPALRPSELQPCGASAIGAAFGAFGASCFGASCAGSLRFGGLLDLGCFRCGSFSGRSLASTGAVSAVPRRRLPRRRLQLLPGRLHGCLRGNLEAFRKKIGERLRQGCLVVTGNIDPAAMPWLRSGPWLQHAALRGGLQPWLQPCSSAGRRP